MLDWITNIITSFGYLGIALLMFLENVFPPIPSFLIMPLAGFTVTQSKLSLQFVILAGTLGSVLGALPVQLTNSKTHGNNWFPVSGWESPQRSGSAFSN